MTAAIASASITLPGHELIGSIRSGPSGFCHRDTVGSGDVGKQRPVVIVQDDLFDATASVTVCALTTDRTDAPLFRIPVDADDTTGIREPSRLMVDEITTVPRSKLGERVGRLSDDEVTRLGRSIAGFLGLASS